MYVCTHAAEVKKGKKIAGTYLVASDTSWTSKEALSRSALRLEALTSVIADIQVLMRNVVRVDSLSMLHTAMGKSCTKSLFVAAVPGYAWLAHYLLVPFA